MKVRAGKIWLAAGITGAMAVGLWSGRAPSFAAAQDADAIRIIEKKMLSASTKKIVYCQGRIRSSYDSAWKGAASLSLSSAKLNIGKKSIGLSLGNKYGGVSINSRTGAQARVSAPGTGLSYTTKLGGKKKRR